MSRSAALPHGAVLPADEFLDALGPGPVGEPEPIEALRQAARAGLARGGLPTRRHEAWRFTDLRPLIEARFGPGSGAPLPELPALGVPAERLVFANRHFDRERSQCHALPAGVQLGHFASWAARHPEPAAALWGPIAGADRAFVALNAAFATDGPVLIVPDGVALARPVHIVHWNDGTASPLRLLVRLGAGASAVIIESFAGRGRGWTNVAATLELGEGARLGRYTIQDEAPEAFHTANLDATLAAGARLDGFLLTLGGRLARQDAHLRLAGAGGHCAYSGAYLLDGQQESTVASLIEHAAVGCASRQVLKGCLADRAHGVFQGKVLVRPHAQKTDAAQVSKTMLLGERAVMDAKPELEILADDVKCSHGATVGDLDDDALFYLRSRGIEPDEARRILIAAFVLDAVEQVADEAARAHLVAAVARRLERI